MKARAAVIAGLGAFAFGFPVDESWATEAMVELKLKLFVVKSGKLVPAAFAQLHISDDSAASRTTDADGQLEIELPSGAHTVNVLMQKQCHFEVKLAPRKPLNVSEVVPDGDATTCQPAVAPKASAASAVSAASAASVAGSAGKASARDGVKATR